ncbi:MAG TPA: MnmC family methyltransferase, partial [Verrucomicrobiae bacterium]|jgi:spermidine synthase
VPPGGEVVDFREGIMASVAVIAEGSNRTLRVDNSFQMGGTASAEAEYRQAHIPLLLHPAPRRALFLGVGTGISFGAASLYPQLKADGVELVPEVVEVMRAFESKNFSPRQQTNLKLHVADARRFVRNSVERYDVIVGDLFHPYRDGAGALYTREHFAAVRECLATNGLFCQWLPLHQFDGPTLRVVIRTFLEEFPKADAWLLRFNVNAPVLGLIGWNGECRFSTNWIESRLADARLATEIKRLALADSVRVFGHLAAGSEDLRHFAEGASLSTDDNPRVTFMAPRLTYERAAKSYASLFALLDATKQSKSALYLSESIGEPEFARRVSNYVTARNVYLRGLALDAEEHRDDAIAAYVESARLSPEFTSGYAQCLTIASVIASSNPARAKKILERLVEAQPERPVAKEMLERLFPK